MKRILSLIFTAFAAVILVSSCFKMEEKDYTFKFQIESTMSSEDPDAEERFNKIVEKIREVEFFNSEPSYFGTYTDTCVKAADEFDKNCVYLDGKGIAALLKDDELVALDMVCQTSGEIIGFIYWSSALASSDD